MYVGETVRAVGERTQEHDKSVKERDSKSALSQHQMMTGHKVLNKPKIECVRVIDSDTRNLHRKVTKAIHIKLRGATRNRTGVHDLLDLYLPLLKEEETRGAGRE